MFVEQRKITEQFFNHALLAGDLFCCLSPESENSLLALKREKQFKKNETILANGKKPCCVYMLLEGDVRLFSNVGAAVHRFQPNEIFGLTEAVANLPYEISVKAVSTCRVEYIRRDDFLRFLHDNPETCFHLLEMLGANIHRISRLFR